MLFEIEAISKSKLFPYCEHESNGKVDKFVVSPRESFCNEKIKGLIFKKIMHRNVHRHVILVR
jgi:hypothetical protein